MTESRLNIRISPEMKDAFYQKVKEEGKNATDVLLDLIEQYLGNKAESGDIVELKHRVAKLEELVLGNCRLREENESLRQLLEKLKEMLKEKPANQ